MKILLCGRKSRPMSQLEAALHAQGHNALFIENTKTGQLPEEPLLVICDSNNAQRDRLAAIRSRKKSAPNRHQSARCC